MSDKAQHGDPAGGGNGDGRPDDEGEGLEARRKRLEAALADRKPKPELSRGEVSDRTSFAQALTLSSEFIAAVAVGFGLGYGLDYLLGTKPWGMIVFLLLGFCAGVLNVMRTAGLVAKPHIWGEDAGKKDGNDRS